MTGKEGFFLAKAQMQESLDGRLEVLDRLLDEAQAEGDTAECALLVHEMKIIEKVRSHFRNSLLWNTEND